VTEQGMDPRTAERRSVCGYPQSLERLHDHLRQVFREPTSLRSRPERRRDLLVFQRLLGGEALQSHRLGPLRG
jgi:hypothetical protein